MKLKITKEDIELKRETTKLLMLYFQGNPREGFESLKQRVRSLRRKGINFIIPI